MELRISKAIAQYLGEDKLRTVGLEWNARSYNDHYTLDLSNLTTSQITLFRDWLYDMVMMGIRENGE